MVLSEPSAYGSEKGKAAISVVEIFVEDILEELLMHGDLKMV